MRAIVWWLNATLSPQTPMKRIGRPPMNTLRLSLLAFSIFVLQGCSTTRSIALILPEGGEQTFTFQDARPAQQRLSHSGASRSGATLYYADDNLSPPPAEVLRRIFMQRVAQLLKGRTVILEKFEVSVTSPDVALDRRALDAAGSPVPSVSSPGAVLGAPVILGIESFKSYKTVTAEIRARIDDKEIFAYRSDEVQGRVNEEDLREVIRVALERAVKEVQKNVRE